MSDFIQKAKADKDINNGAAIVSSRTDGDAPEHHVQNSQLSEKTQTDNEAKLENKFGNKFKYFDSTTEIRRMQSKGGGVNKTLRQLGLSLDAVKEITNINTANLAVGMVVSGANIPAGAKIVSIKESGTNGTITIDTPITTGSGANVASIVFTETETGNIPSSGSAVITSVETTNLAVGMTVSGTNIPVGTTIQSVDSATQITLSAAVSAGSGSSGATLTFTETETGDTPSAQLYNQDNPFESKTVVTKAEEDKDFNSGGAVSNAGGGSTFSDTLETPLSEKDQSDTATVINDKIGQSVQTGSNTGSQDAAVIKQEIVNNDKEVSVADTTTDSEGLEKGGCPEPQTRGSSRLLPNLLTVNLTDKDGNFGDVSINFGGGSCDCYVPLNLPLLGALGKLAKIPGKIAGSVAKLINEGNPFLGMLSWIGGLGKYRAAVKTHIKTKEIFPLSVGGRTGLTFEKALDKINVVVRKFTEQKRFAKSAEEAARRLISVTNEKIAIAARKKAEALAHKDNLFNQYFGPPDGASTITTMKGQVFNNYLEALEDIIHRRGRKTEHPVDIFEAFGNDPLYISDAQSITGKLVEYRGMDGVINNITKVQTELTAELAEASAERIVQRDLFNQAQTQLALAHKKKIDWDQQFANKVASAEASDVFGLFQSLFGYSFEVLAAIDPSRKKNMFRNRNNT